MTETLRCLFDDEHGAAGGRAEVHWLEGSTPAEVIVLPGESGKKGTFDDTNTISIQTGGQSTGLVAGNQPGATGF